MKYYKARKIPGIGERPRWIVEDENGNIVNKNPTKEELKGLKTFPKENYKRKRRKCYTDEELLDYLRQFDKENGRPPTERDFINNPEYPGTSTYQRMFGSWINSLIKAGLNIDLMGPQGKSYRGRQAEIAGSKIVKSISLSVQMVILMK